MPKATIRSVVGVSAIGVFAASFAAAFSGYDPRLMIVDWQMTATLPISVENDLEIAESGHLFKRSSLRLVCGSGAPHLVLHSDFHLPPNFNFNARDEAILFVGGTTHKFELEARLVGNGFLKTTITEALDDHQIHKLSTALDLTGTKKVSFMVFETGTNMKAVAKSSEIRGFANACG